MNKEAWAEPALPASPAVRHRVVPDVPAPAHVRHYPGLSTSGPARPPAHDTRIPPDISPDESRAAMASRGTATSPSPGAGGLVTEAAEFVRAAGTVDIPDSPRAY